MTDVKIAIEDAKALHAVLGTVVKGEEKEAADKETVSKKANKVADLLLANGLISTDSREKVAEAIADHSTSLDYVKHAVDMVIGLRKENENLKGEKKASHSLGHVRTDKEKTASADDSVPGHVKLSEAEDRFAERIQAAAGSL